VCRDERSSDGWYYRQAGGVFGPVPTARLKELLAAGRLRPRQAVWRRDGHGLRFVHAAAAASGTTPPSCPPPAEQVPA
jgi:hypothetical protein